MSAEHEHNASAQTGVVPNPDPALDVSREHHHAHLHHSEMATKGREDDVVYSKGTTDEKSIIPDANVMDNSLHKLGHPEKHDHDHDTYDIKDAENLSRRPSDENSSHKSTGRIKRFYAKYKVFFHAYIWLHFTA